MTFHAKTGKDNAWFNFNNFYMFPFRVEMCYSPQSRIISFQRYKHYTLISNPYFIRQNFKGTAMNQDLSSLHGGSLKSTLTTLSIIKIPPQWRNIFYKILLSFQKRNAVKRRSCNLPFDFIVFFVIFFRKFHLEFLYYWSCNIFN